MSGDVQPRKRKDKKRRKDEGEQIPIQTHAPSPTNSTTTDDVNIHVHKEGGTGGGICAKLVFFVLLSALVMVIGLIITQYRGLTDIETVDTESKFSLIFEGWIDSSPDHHYDHNIEEALNDHDLDHDDEDDDHNASEDDEEEDEYEPSEEEEDEEDENADVSDERNEDDEDDGDEDEEDQAVEESEENQLDEDEDDDDVQASEEERETYESDEKNEEDDDEDEEYHEEDEQELENIESEEGKYEDDDVDDEVSAERKSGEDDEDQDDDEAEDEDDRSAEKVPITTKKVETRHAADDVQGEEEEEHPNSGTSNMAVKLGVGVALLVVAHLVLVRKWRTAPDGKPKPSKEEPNEPMPDLKRRNTIIAPPTFQEVEPDIEPEEEDYSEEEEDDVSEEEEEAHGHKSAKTRYQELRSTYTRSLTPEGEIDYHKPPETNDDDEDEENLEDEEDEEEVSEEEEEEDDEEKQEGEYEEDEEYDEDEDEELLKRLEAKYGKLQGEGAAERQADVENSDSEKSEDGAENEFSNITNEGEIKEGVYVAEKSIKNNSAYAIKLFDKILQKYPSSPRSIYGKALALDYLADQRRSNNILEQAFKFYIQLLNIENVPNALFSVVAERCINRMRFAGQFKNAINVHKLLIQRFPNNPKHSNDLAVTYLTINRVEEARSIVEKILEKWPYNGCALVHYGFILKTVDKKLEKAIEYLRKGLDTRAKCVVDGRFYFHLGDALVRVGQNDEAMKIYEEGVRNKVFISKYQRSFYNIPRLTGKPWWDLSELPYQDLFRLLEENWEKIRDEGLAVMNEKGYFQDESENLKDTGDWKQFDLFYRGQRTPNCGTCPFTCSIIERIPEARNCKRGQIKFSVMHPGTHVWPHCGPTNCRLRAHLGLKVPPNTFIRVAEETRSWEEGKVLIFDDGFEHEVWHNGSDFRLVLIVDIWHPELTEAEKRGLLPI